MTYWIELREPGLVPERKGAFPTPAMLKAFLIDVFKHRPAALISVVTVHHTGPEFEDGTQWLEIKDGRYRHLAARHRRNSAEAWRNAPRKA